MGILEFGLMALVGVAVFVAAGILSAEMDSALLSVATFVIGLLTLQFGFEIAVWSAFVANPLLAVGAVIIYVALGAVYTAVWKWPDYIRKNKERIMSSYNDWARKKNQNNADNSFEAFLDSDSYEYSASDHKERLATWTGMWPFSFVWDVSRRPAIWLWEVVYTSLGEAFQRISKRTARKIHERGE
jgi:hypothetical protein